MNVALHPPAATAPSLPRPTRSESRPRRAAPDSTCPPMTRPRMTRPRVTPRWLTFRRGVSPTRARRRLDWGDDRGQVGGIEVVPFSILVFVVGSLLVLNAWAVVDVRSAVDAATREAVRTFVEAPDPATATARADTAARATVSGYGRDPGKLDIGPADLGPSGTFERCAPVTITASYPVPIVSLPFVGGRGDGFRVTASHTEVIDPYRSGLDASGRCR